VEIVFAATIVETPRARVLFVPMRSTASGDYQIRATLATLQKSAKQVRARHGARHTPKRALRQVDFVFGGNEIRGLEQNSEAKSRWAQMARSGKKVMQFLSEGRYVANVVDGKVTKYGRRAGTNR
jgi:hypothetical protein